MNLLLSMGAFHAMCNLRKDSRDQQRDSRACHAVKHKIR